MSGSEYAVLVVLIVVYVVGVWSIVCGIYKMVYGWIESRRVEKKELYDRIRQIERDVKGSVWGSSFDQMIRELNDRMYCLEDKHFTKSGKSVCKLKVGRVAQS